MNNPFLVPVIMTLIEWSVIIFFIVRSYRGFKKLKQRVTKLEIQMTEIKKEKTS